MEQIYVYVIQATTGLPALAMAARQSGRRQRLATRRRQSTRQRPPAGANREQWRYPPAFRRGAGKGLENLLALAGEGGIAPAIAWHTPLEVDWRWPTPQRFDVAGISTQGYHGDVSFPMTLRGKIPPTLSGVLTLSTCSNVCILTDYPFSLDMTAPPGGFGYDFTRAMGTLPLGYGLTSQLTASYVSGKLTVTARRDAGWQQPALFIDSMEDVDFGKPSFTSRGDTLTATIPVTDSWGEAAPDLRGKTLSLVLADSGQAQESQIAISAGSAGSAAPELTLGWVLLMALAGGLSSM